MGCSIWGGSSVGSSAGLIANDAGSIRAAMRYPEVEGLVCDRLAWATKSRCVPPAMQASTSAASRHLSACAHSQRRRVGGGAEGGDSQIQVERPLSECVGGGTLTHTM